MVKPKILTDPLVKRNWRYDDFAVICGVIVITIIITYYYYYYPQAGGAAQRFIMARSL